MVSWFWMHCLNRYHSYRRSIARSGRWLMMRNRMVGYWFMSWTKRRNKVRCMSRSMCRSMMWSFSRYENWDMRNRMSFYWNHWSWTKAWSRRWVGVMHRMEFLNYWSW